MILETIFSLLLIVILSDFFTFLYSPKSVRIGNTGGKCESAISTKHLTFIAGDDCVNSQIRFVKANNKTRFNPGLDFANINPNNNANSKITKPI